MKLKYFNDADDFKGNMDKMDPLLLGKLDSLRKEYGFPIIINSSYRSPEHPIEAAKKVPGTHAQGIAADILVKNANQRYCIVEKATELGFKGVGVHKSFVHVDIRDVENPVLWLY